MTRLIQIILISLLAISPATAQEKPQGKEFKLCVNCHGEDGLSEKEEVPIIAGVPAVVQEDALYAYRDDARTCGENPMMCKLAAKLSDEAIVEYSAYYAAQPFQPAGDPYDEALAAKGKEIHNDLCVKCHGTAEEIDLEAGMLFGQKKGYLRYALSQYAAGEREQLPAMADKTKDLTDEQIEALLNYYASYRN